MLSYNPAVFTAKQDGTLNFEALRIYIACKT